jgi:DNA-binding NtrC family response regulator
LRSYITKDEDAKSDLNGLRTQVVAVLLRKSGEEIADLQALPKEDIQILIHELRVHEIALEMQNAELHRAHVSSFPLQERTLHDVMDEVIKSLCLEALRRCAGNRRCAARTLGIARDSLYRHMKRFGIMSENRTAGLDD